MQQAGEFFIAHVLALTQPFAQSIESRHLAAPQPRLLGGGAVPQRPVEGGVGLDGTSHVQHLGNPGEGATLVAK